MAKLNLKAAKLTKILAVGLLCSVAISLSLASRAYLTESPESIRSVTFEARHQPAISDIQAIADLGATHITLIPFGFQRSQEQTTLRFNPDARWFTESDDGLRLVSKWAAEIGMKTIIKPHIWVGGHNGEGQWRDKIAFDSEDQWHEWEASYRTFIMHYAELAATVDADVFVVGTELTSVARQRPDFWRGIIRDVRGVFNGDLTYAANWWEEYEHIEFWDDLDYIGVQAYFPIYEGEDRPDVLQLMEGWNRHNDTLGELSARVDRPVMFTEIGYRSVDYAAATPWVWASRRNQEGESVDMEIQADLYSAFFKAVWTKPWFSGAILWKWHASTEMRKNETDFSPQGKPAELVIKDNFLSR